MFTPPEPLKGCSGIERGGSDDAVGFSDGPTSPLFPRPTRRSSLVVMVAAAAAPCSSDENVGTKAMVWFGTGANEDGITVEGSADCVTCSGLLSSRYIPSSMNGLRLVDGWATRVRRRRYQINATISVMTAMTPTIIPAMAPAPGTGDEDKGEE